MRSTVFLAFFFAVAFGQQFLDPNPCPSSTPDEQIYSVPEVSGITVQILNTPGQIEVVRGPNGTNPTFAVQTYTTGTVDIVTRPEMINGVLRISVGVNLPPLTPPGTENEEYFGTDASAGSSLKAALPLTVAAALASSKTRFVGAAMLPLLWTQADAQCSFARVILTLPGDFAEPLSSEVDKIYNQTINGKISYTVGQNLPGGAGSLGTCLVDGVQGECIDINKTPCGTKNKARGFCPGAANIQCCVDSFGTCCANGNTGVCRSTAGCAAAGGVSTPGVCTGVAADVQCCTIGRNQQCVPGAGATSYSATKAAVISGVPFAPMTGKFWPIKQSTRTTICYKTAAGLTSVPLPVPQYGTVGGKVSYGCETRMFLGSRGDRLHVAVDLYAPLDTPIVAVEDGTIVNFYGFTDTSCCIIQQTVSGTVINYGEVSCSGALPSGTKVKAGQPIGKVGQAFPSVVPMLHFETYTSGTTQNARVYVGGSIPSNIRNPTEYLLALREKGQ